MIRILLVCLIAGSAAGLGTGFAGLSAATIISPMLISFLGYPWYESVGIGLAADVLASAISAYIYRRNKNVDLKNGIYMLVAVMCMTFVGSFFSQFMPDLQMGYISIIFSILMGLNFVIHPISRQRTDFLPADEKIKVRISVICGIAIGLYCGFMGVGGGMMMLFILTYVLGYDVKKAVGTSVFIMAFTALTGAASHYYFGHVQQYWPTLLLCVAFTLVCAVLSSHFANRMSTKQTNRVTGVKLLILGIAMILERVLGIPG